MQMTSTDQHAAHRSSYPTEALTVEDHFGLCLPVVLFKEPPLEMAAVPLGKVKLTSFGNLLLEASKTPYSACMKPGITKQTTNRV